MWWKADHRNVFSGLSGLPTLFGGQDGPPENAGPSTTRTDDQLESAPDTFDIRDVLGIRYVSFSLNIFVLSGASCHDNSAYRADRPADQTGWSLCLSFFLQPAEKLIIFLFEFSLPGTYKNCSIPEWKVEQLDLKILHVFSKIGAKF